MANVKNFAVTPVKKEVHTDNLNLIRNKILDLCEDYMVERGDQYIIPGEDFIPASSKVLDSSDLKALVESSLDLWLTSGRFSEKFEKELAKKFGSKKSILTVSGSAANLLAFSSLTSPMLKERRIKPGDEVITVAAGFPTTVFPIVQNNCVPVFLDVSLDDYNIKVEDLEKALSPKTRAVMIAHTVGNPFNLEKVSQFCKRNNLFLVEDCCDAFGAKFDGNHVGSYGDFATMSFYPAHHITAGEGGAVFTNNIKLARIAESYRDWGRDCYCHTGMNNTCGKRFGWKLGKLPEGYDHKFIYSHIGYNLKMTDMQAALGLSQLKKLDKFVNKRIENFHILDDLMKKKGLDKYFILPKKSYKSEPSWFGYMVTLREETNLNRRDIINFLEDNKIITRLLFAGNLTKQPAFEEIDFRVIGNLENTDLIMNNTFWVGIYPGLDSDHLEYISDKFLEAVNK